MSSNTGFPLRGTKVARSARYAAVAAVLLMLVGGSPAAALADDQSSQQLVLSGPHPFLKENAVTVHYLLGYGFGDSFSGNGVGVGYGYMLDGPLWLDMQINVRGDGCGFTPGCGPYRGNDAELLAGVAWRFQTAIPLVPYVRADAGLVYLFPRSHSSAVGLTTRSGVGAKYYPYDWFGFGLDIGLSLGHAFFDATYTGSHTYTLLDIGLGVELQF